MTTIQKIDLKQHDADLAQLATKYLKAYFEGKEYIEVGTRLKNESSQHLLAIVREVGFPFSINGDSVSEVPSHSSRLDPYKLISLVADLLDPTGKKKKVIELHTSILIKEATEQVPYSYAKITRKF